MSSSKGKTICKEVTSDCKCTIVEKPLTKKGKEKKSDVCDTDKKNADICDTDRKKDKKECVATIVGVLSLPDNFCGEQKDECEEKDPCDDGKSEKDECDESEKDDDCDDDKKDKCVEVYRDLGECLQKCILKTSKGTKKKC